MSVFPCKTWCVIKCYTAEEKSDFEIKFDEEVTLDELNSHVRTTCGDSYRCYMLRNGTLKRLRRNSDFQTLIQNSPQNVEIYVKISRTLSISKKLPTPPTSLSFEDPGQQYNVVDQPLHHISGILPENSVSTENSTQNVPFKKGHRRSRSAHATYHQHRTVSTYVPEPLTPDFTIHRRLPFNEDGGGRFVPAGQSGLDRNMTPDSGFQSPENILTMGYNSYSTDSSLTPISTPVTYNESELPRHLYEEFPYDFKPKQLSKDDMSISTSHSDALNNLILEKKENSAIDLCLPENYQIKDMIGSGGFAKVYHCIDKDTGRDLAVKQVYYDKNCKDSENELNALKNEIDILKKLKHPHIVIYFGCSNENGLFNIFMEYVSGGSMRTFIQNNGPLSNKLTVKCISHILLGLSYLHQENIIHRDLKAANVLKTTSGTIKIADFGASKRFDTLRSIKSGANTVVGTPYWMSPEVIKAESYDNKVDVWGVGVTTVEFLFGNPPFFHFEPIAAMFKIAQKPMKKELIFPDTVPESLKDFVLNCLEQEPTDRPTVNDLLKGPMFSAHVR